MEQIVKRVKEAVIESSIVWEEVDYLEGVRYIALNWTQEECNRSKLRRVLPVRRGRTGCRPGLRGAGPRGRTKGDQEQWRFQDVILEDWDRREIVGEVVSLATKAMFNNHFYKF